MRVLAAWCRSETKTPIAIILAALAVATVVSGSATHLPPSQALGSGRPLLIRQGPLGVSSAAAGGPFWFQQGAFAGSATYNSVGASVMIKTVYDPLNNDAHSYWVGSKLSNGAFVQVGYLNGLTTTGQYYCCAWFYEFFPPNNTTSPPIIGDIGSAGPMGALHTYTMNSTGNGVWSFYMDSQYLGSSPAAGNPWNLGSSNTGQNEVAALSEVADTTGRSDIIGPGEFKNLQYSTSNPNSLQPVQTGTTHIGCGQAPVSCLPNPYGVAEIEKTPNDFLSGSLVPAGQDECGNSAGNGSPLWSPTMGTLCLASTFSFSFVDRDGNSIAPAWISLIDNASTEIFFTSYQSQNITSPSGQWRVNQVSWHSINVTLNEIINVSAGSQVILTNVFSIQLSVVGYFYSLPVKNATVIMYLPDLTNETLKTDANGQATFSRLPPASYSLHISVPYGITSNQVHAISARGSLVAKVFSLPELITIIVPPILFAILASAAVARREHRRQAMMPTQPFPAPMAGPMYCRHCGQPLAPTANFCTSCGTPVRMMVQ